MLGAVDVLVVDEGGEVSSRVRMHRIDGSSGVPSALLSVLGGEGVVRLTIRSSHDRVGVAAWASADAWGHGFNATACMMASVIAGGSPMDGGDLWQQVYTSVLCGPVLFSGLEGGGDRFCSLPSHVFDQVGAYFAVEFVT